MTWQPGVPATAAAWPEQSAVYNVSYAGTRPERYFVRTALLALSLDATAHFTYVPGLVFQAELDNGASIAALRRFNDNLANLTAENWGED